MILYVKKYCPFCQKVLAFIEEKKLENQFEYREIGDENVAKELIERGGKKMAPYLVDEKNSVEMYESDDIIAYLQKQYA